MLKRVSSKLIGLGIAFVIGAVLSAIISFCLVKIFSKVPLEILDMDVLKVIQNIAQNKYGLQLFVLTLLAFMLFMAVSVFKVFDLDDYLSKTYSVTPDIKIPIPVGKGQTQQGSAWWLSKQNLYKKPFGVNTFDVQNPTISNLLKFSERQKVVEEAKIRRLELLNSGGETDNIDELVPIPKEIQLTSEEKASLNNPIFKEGGICVGKRDRTIFNPHVKKLFGKIPIIAISSRKVEDIFYIKEDMHSLTVGATRSGKTRCLVLESIANTALAGENMILSDPKGELFEYTSRSFKPNGL